MRSPEVADMSDDVERCSMESCLWPTYLKGFCRRHYARLTRYGDPALQIRSKRGRHDPPAAVGLDMTGTSRAADMARHATAVLAPREPQTLYRFFDADDRLLYVGISSSAGHRFAQHGRGQDRKPWWPDVATIKIEHYADRRSVEEAEARAIANEQPAYNVIGNMNPIPLDEGGDLSGWSPKGSGTMSTLPCGYCEAGVDHSANACVGAP